LSGIHLVVAAHGPEVDDLRLAEEGDVDRMVQVVMRDEDVGHVVRRDAEPLQRIEDQRAALDHARVDDDHPVAVADQPTVPATDGESA
jgi:hypothetical protein